MRTLKKTSYFFICSVSLVLLSSCAAGPDNKQNSLRPEGQAAEKIMNLFSPIFWVATVIGIGVLLGTLYVSFRFRETKKNKAPKQIHGNSILEIGWTILPIVILIGIAIPTVKTIFDLDRAVGPGAIKVEVTGKQWWWQFGVETASYQVYNVDGTVKLDENSRPVMANKVYTANELVVPANTELHLDLHACNAPTPIVGKSTDELKDANPCNVVHSFWIPSLGGKKDVVPGRVNTLKLKTGKEGLYTGQCAEYCGLSHSMMRMQVRVVSREQYDAWIKRLQKPSKIASVPLEGQKDTPAQAAIRKFGCANCHVFDDPSTASYGPNLTHFGPDFDDEVLGGGSIPKTVDHTWKWIFNATDWQNGNGIPMQADDCRLGVTPGKGKRCVGMPNFSVPYDNVDEKGNVVTYPAMTQEEAKAIAIYLMDNK